MADDRSKGPSSVVSRRLEAPYSGEAFMACALEPGALDEREWRVGYPRAFEEVA
jgi:hypothetical protein